MKYLKQLLIILIISFIGELLHSFLPFPIPASIYGIVLMLAGLLSGLVPLAAVKETSSFLVNIMPVMFISPAAGILEISDRVQGKWATYLIIVIVSTMVVMGVAGMVTQTSAKHRNRDRKG